MAQTQDTKRKFHTKMSFINLSQLIILLLLLSFGYLISGKHVIEYEKLTNEKIHQPFHDLQTENSKRFVNKKGFEENSSKFLQNGGKNSNG